MGPAHPCLSVNYLSVDYLSGLPVWTTCLDYLSGTTCLWTTCLDYLSVNYLSGLPVWTTCLDYLSVDYLSVDYLSGSTCL